MGLLNLFKRARTFRHGVHPMDHKEQTAHLAIKRLPFAPKVYVPLAQHIGAPAVALVKPGQEVVRGEPIAEAGGFVSVPMHAPVTGIVRSIDHLVPTAAGPKTPAIVIETYEAATQEVLYGLDQDLDTLTRDELIKAVQASGMVGLGGAAFPSHVKLLPPEGKIIETLIINGCECEPYLTCDHRVMLEQTDRLIAGIRTIMRATGARQAIIGVEDNKLDAVKAIRDKLPAGEAISCEAVETKYPQGAEKMLIKSLLNREVPSGGLPVDIGVAVYNVGTMAQLGELIPRSRGLIERVVTVSGPGVGKPGNYLVPIGTPLRFLMEQVGSSSEANEVIVGGPMMGMTVASLDGPVTKGLSGVVVFEVEAEDQQERPVYPCIKCGACLDACPINLNPSMLGQLASVRQYDVMAADFHLNDCFECGCCSYVCPSNIPLTQYFRIAKAVNREARAVAA
ncbi:electron transport complex subunit RsxC [Sedimenticola selenatireducens]|uniref:Ion-translocating oxidoreductase complex subunit C n=1 Tax=Sedimenticola selenatireducens TaxID=191960 RepID=A0A2N6D0E0_9GAMM|nr:electron transport complex subunit RsxC [Sedimenticola selenatireducens]PLX63133.1 MAG: electron transport complex subunit RsxC [Sedimenticola selenatireducens]